MLKGARKVDLDWPSSNAVMDKLRVAANSSNMVEPAIDMIVANLLQRQALTALSGDVGFDGRIRKILGSVDESMDSGSCCRQQCPLGRSVGNQYRRSSPWPEPPSPQIPSSLAASRLAPRPSPLAPCPFQVCVCAGLKPSHFRSTVVGRWVALAQLQNSSLKGSDMPTAVLLPCTAFKGTIAMGVVTDHDLRRTILSAQAIAGYTE
jgi:hypothetical protein